MLNIFRANLHFWICPTVYVWALAFQANISFGYEPLFERIVDGAAILLTGVFWAGSLYTLITVLLLLTRQSSYIAGLSRFLCEATILGGSVFYFNRWLRNWGSLPFPLVIGLTGLIGGISLATWIIYRHRQTSKPTANSHTLLQDFFKFGALPILAIAVGLVITRITIHGLGQSYVRSSNANVQTLAPSTRPNVILVVMDTLRAGNMSLYGYKRNTTPSIDKFAQNSTTYLRAYTNATATTVSVTSILTGKYPINHGRISPLRPPYRSEENLLRALTNSGYATAAITSARVGSLYDLGFSEMLTVPEVATFQLHSLHPLKNFGVSPTLTGERIYDDLMVLLHLGLYQPFDLYGPASNTLKQAQALIPALNEPFFLYVHTFEPHDPYLSEPPFDMMYSTPESEILRKGSTIRLYDYYPPEEQLVVDAYRDKYDESISFLDHELGNLFDYLENSTRGQNTLVILTSDHGESFERGYLGHGAEMYETSAWIPLIIRWPNKKKGERVDSLAQSVDIAPTILNATGSPVPSWMDGRALAPETSLPASEAVAINYRHSVKNTIQTLPTKLAIWSMPYKAIFHCDTVHTELYDLEKAPGETNDLSVQEPALREELTRRLQKYLEKGSGKELLSCTGREFLQKMEVHREK